MKRIVVCLLLLAMLACVPAPEEEVVVNKADGTPNDAIRSVQELFSGDVNPVPVRFFTGVYEFSEQEAANRRADGLSDTQAAREYPDNLNPLLIINAVDGSMIDTINGY